jgi:hypothetical protein
MTFTETTANEIKSDSDRYVEELFSAALYGNVQGLKDILYELDQREAFTMKKELLNMGMLKMIILKNENTVIQLDRLSPYDFSDYLYLTIELLNGTLTYDR